MIAPFAMISEKDPSEAVKVVFTLTQPSSRNGASEGKRFGP